MKLKFAIAVGVSLILGFAVGRRSVDTSLIRAPEAPSEKPQNLENLQKIVDFDLQEYNRLKSEEARYKKADEILSKIITIFLADLGMKISKPSEASVSQVVNPTATPHENGSQSLAMPKPKTEAQGPTVNARQPISEVRTPEDIGEFLKASPTNNFEDAIRSSSAFSNRAGQLQNYSGQFVGAAQVTSEGKVEQWQIEMRLNARMADSKLMGRRSLKLSKNGRVFSNSSGNGGLDQAYREISSDPEAIVIAAGPDTYLQAYYVRSTDQIVGHVVRKGGVSDPYKSIGNFELSRR